MSDMTGFSRRQLIGGLTAGAAITAAPIARAATCAFTPAGPEGPFFPVKIRETDADLTMVRGADGRAQGTVIEVSGRIVNKTCRPLVSARVELWQANAAGRYDHPNDNANAAPLDPNFQGFSQLYTDAKGMFRFLTIKPGAYAVNDGWWRPPHIHFKITPVSAPYLITQMYFAGEELNDQDRILSDIDPNERDRVVIDFSGTGSAGVPAGTFDMVVGAA
jgi:protocatechuate 3,4-dioxygenase beta subunit